MSTNDPAQALVEALEHIATIGCTLDPPGEERTFCRADGTAHSIYCAAGIARAALDAYDRATAAPPPPSAPAGEHRCDDCGSTMNAGERRTFIVCDACWDRAHPKPCTSPVSPAPHARGPGCQGGDAATFPRAPVDEVEREAVENWDADGLFCGFRWPSGVGEWTCVRRPHSDGDHVACIGSQHREPICARWSPPAGEGK